MDRGRIWRFLLVSAGLALVALAAAFAGARAFQASKIPFALLWLTAEAFLFCWAARSEGLRNAALALGVTLFVITAADIGLRAIDKPRRTVEVTSGSSGHDFGQPRSSPLQIRSILTLAATGEVIYDTTYTLDRHGFRLTEGGGPGADTYLFFGDSFTYGEGIADDETLPSQFARAMGGRITAVNLANRGFGPQNMLHLIETDAFAAAVTGPVRHAYYLAINTHADRVVGMNSWNLWSARYVLDASGEPRFTGLFADRLTYRVIDRLDLWRGLPQLIARYVRSVGSTPEQRVELAAAVIAKSARLLAERYQAPLTVLLWDSPDTSALEAALARRQIGATRLSGLLGDLESPEVLIRPPFENHPNGRADREIANWLAQEAMAAAGPAPTGP